MKVTILGSGTSGGVPMLACDCFTCTSPDEKDKRLRSSIMIEADQSCVVIDTGPDFRQQMLRENVKRIDAILYTHEHKDHTGGLDDIRAFNFAMKSSIDAYAEERVCKALKEQYPYIFEDNPYPGIPKVDFVLIRQEPFYTSQMQFIPIRAMHYKLPVLGFRTGNFSYLTDANFIEDEELEKMKGTEVLVINALRKQKHISHFNLEEALVIVDKLKPDKTYLTHISHQMGRHEEISPTLPDNVEFAYDGLKIYL